jgi:hypothetical protein
VAEVVARKGTAKKAATKKAAKKAATKKAAKKATAKEAASPPAGEADQPAGQDDATPPGSRPTEPLQAEDELVYTSDSGDGAGPAAAPSGHLEQPVVDPALTKAVAAEADTGQRAADPDKG